MYKKTNRSPVGKLQATKYMCNWNAQRRGKGTEKICKETMAKKLSNLMKTITLQIQEVQQIPSTRNTKKTMSIHHNQIACEQKILKAVRERNMYRRTKVRMTVDFF